MTRLRVVGYSGDMKIYRVEIQDRHRRWFSIGPNAVRSDSNLHALVETDLARLRRTDLLPECHVTWVAGDVGAKNWQFLRTTFEGSEQESTYWPEWRFELDTTHPNTGKIFTMDSRWSENMDELFLEMGRVWRNTKGREDKTLSIRFYERLGPHEEEKVLDADLFPGLDILRKFLSVYGV